jgi:hypothetical protein
MVSRVAQYDVLFDGGFELDTATNAKERKLYWRRPLNIVRSNVAKPMLAFMLVPLGGTGARFEIYVNHRRILRWGPIRTDRGLWAPFSMQNVFPENTSTPSNVEVRILSDAGRMRFEHVVMWCQVKL